MTPSPTSGTLARTGREATRDFRILLDCLANPGRIGRLDVPAGVPAALVPVLSLADVEVALAVLDAPGSDWAERLRMTTGARSVAPDRAELLLALRPATAGDIAAVPRGDDHRPEMGCRLVLAVDALSKQPLPDELTVTTSGPGVPGRRTFSVAGLAPAVIDALTEANASFPRGVDTFLVDAAGQVAALPRSNRLRAERSS